MPSNSLTQVTAGERREKAAEVDPHIEYRESGIPPDVSGRVELTDDGTDVGLQQARTQNNEHQAKIEKAETVKNERVMTESDQHTADKHSIPQAKKSVRNPAARQTAQVDRGSVQAIDSSSLGHCESKAADRGTGGHKQNQQCAHAIIAEALPHFRKEQSRQPPRVAKETTVKIVRPCSKSDIREFSCGQGKGSVVHATVVRVEMICGSVLWKADRKSKSAAQKATVITSQRTASSGSDLTMNAAKSTA